MDILESIKSFFVKKSNNEETPKAPEGVCPNCWGSQDWEGEYYKFMKGEKGNPSTETYNTFVQDVARKLDKITVNKDTYTCETCHVKY